MPRIITYSLRRGAQNSDEYYRVIARFTDDWTAHAVRVLKDVFISFRLFRQEAGLNDRSDAEYAFELLALGVLLRERGAAAARSPGWWMRAHRWLVEAQDRWPHWESWSSPFARGRKPAFTSVVARFSPGIKKPRTV